MTKEDKQEGKFEERIIASSFHLDFFNLTIESFKAFQKQTDRSEYWHLNRHCIDTIIYAYTCIEATIEYIHHMGQDGDIYGPELENTWLVRRYINAGPWDRLSLLDKIGLVTFALSGNSFWENTNQLDLFNDLRHIRDKLIHLSVYEWKEKYEGREEVTKTFLGRGKKSIASFSNNPRDLNIHDAEKAVEIMLRILLQMEKISPVPTRICVYSDAKGFVHGTTLLKELNCHFEEQWTEKDGGV